VAPTTPGVAGVLANVQSGVSYRITDPETPNRGFVAELAISNPSAAAQSVTVTITGSTPAGFPRYFEAADYDQAVFTCTNASGQGYYRTSVTEAAFTCTGSLPAATTSVITLSSGSLIAAAAIGQPVTVSASASPGGSTKALQGTFA
jgi:hypothetical protein